MESVWQNAPLFPKSQIFANLFFAQTFYLRHLRIFAPKVAKVTVVTRRGRKSAVWPKYYYADILQIVYFSCSAPISPHRFIFLVPASPASPCTQRFAAITTKPGCRPRRGGGDTFGAPPNTRLAPTGGAVSGSARTARAHGSGDPAQLQNLRLSPPVSAGTTLTVVTAPRAFGVIVRRHVPGV